MKKTVNIIFLGIITLFFSACFKEEAIIELPPTTGDLQVGEITQNMYNNQIFFNLGTNSVVKTNANTDWDLGFACAADTWHIILNNSKVMLAGNSQTSNFEQVTEVGDIEMNFDNSGGYTDSLSISNWLDDSQEAMSATGYVYIIDRGYDENYSHLGYKKVQFETPENNSYKIRFADLDGSNEQNISIEKNDTKNYRCLSFDNGISNIEPAKTDWTLLFTSYQTMLYAGGEPVPYLVRGVLINPYKVKAVPDTTFDFSEIMINDTADFNYSAQRDAIGYQWKYYDFDNGTYSVLENQNYVLKAQDEYFYKLRFISFYNDENEKGFPVFEFSKL
jgi:hypothetical protein